MRNISFVLMSLVTVLTLTACEKTRETLGLKRTQADEFEVLDREPLSTPPSFNLRPPVPGKAIETPHKNPSKTAKEALLGKEKETKTSSSSETEILKKSKTESNKKDIRSAVDAVASKEPAEAKAPGEDLIFWKKGSSATKGDTIDPVAEKKRLDDARKDAGNPASE